MLEEGDVAYVSITDISKDYLLEPLLIVSLKQQRNKQVVIAVGVYVFILLTFFVETVLLR